MLRVLEKKIELRLACQARRCFGKASESSLASDFSKHLLHSRSEINFASCWLYFVSIRVFYSTSLRLAPSLHIQLSLGLCAGARVLCDLIRHAHLCGVAFGTLSRSARLWLKKMSYAIPDMLLMFSNHCGLRS